jgi:hypothetical protein
MSKASPAKYESLAVANATLDATEDDRDALLVRVAELEAAAKELADPECNVDLQLRALVRELADALEWGAYDGARRGPGDRCGYCGRETLRCGNDDPCRGDDDRALIARAREMVGSSDEAGGGG